MPKRRMFRKEGLILIYSAPFLFQVFPNRAGQSWVGEMVQAVSFYRQVTPRQFVLPLRPGFNPHQLVLNGKVYGLIITGVKMQEIMMLARPPIAAVERLRPNEIQRPRDNAAFAPRQNEQYMLPHAFADQAEKTSVSDRANPISANLFPCRNQKTHPNGFRGGPCP